MGAIRYTFPDRSNSRTWDFTLFPQAFRGRNWLLERLVIGWHKCRNYLPCVCNCMMSIASTIVLSSLPLSYFRFRSFPFVRRRVLFDADQDFFSEGNASFEGSILLDFSLASMFVCLFICKCSQYIYREFNFYNIHLTKKYCTLNGLFTIAYSYFFPSIMI